MAPGVAVAIETKTHAQVNRRVDARHRRDVTVTCGARDALMDVNSMVEIHKIRNVGNALPNQWPLALPALAQRREQWAFGVNLRMAAHAQRGIG